MPPSPPSDSSDISPSRFRSEYALSIIANLGIVSVAMAAEWQLGALQPRIPDFPQNLAVLILLALNLFFAPRFFTNKWITWLAGIPNTLVTLCLYSLLVLWMGLVPQTQDLQTGFLHTSGLDHVARSWLFFLASMFLLAALGLVIGKRARILRLKDFRFYLVHGGAWLTIASGAFGGSDVVRLKANLTPGTPVEFAQNAEGNRVALPFSIELQRFELEESVPSIGLADLQAGRFLTEKGGALLYADMRSGVCMGFRITVLSFLPLALPDGDSFVPDSADGAAPAAFIEAQNGIPGQNWKGWISSGSFFFEPRMIQVSDSTCLAMSLPAPKAYRSVFLIRDSQTTLSGSAEVNRPFSSHSFRIYQAGFEESLGRASRYSTLEFIKDPWLPGVYLGLFMVLAGALLLAWRGGFNLN